MATALEMRLSAHFAVTFYVAVSLSPYRPVMPGAGGLICKVVRKTGPTQGRNFPIDHRGVLNGGVGTRSARVVIASVAVIVLTCLALIYIG